MLNKNDWDFSERNMNKIKDILKDNLKYIINISSSSETEDMKQSTDLKFSISGTDVAVRIRRNNCKWRDLTIRSYSRGYKTELDKLREGYVKWYLYLWTDDKENISEWILVDVDILRKSGLIYIDKKSISNKDGTEFISFSLDELNNVNSIVSSKL